MSGRKNNNGNYTAGDLFKLLAIPTIICIVMYLSPIDLIPDVVPVVGTLDDFIISTVFMSSSYKKNYQEITGRTFEGSLLLSKSKMVTVSVEHVITSIVQLFADIGVATVAATPLLSSIDMIVFLVLFYVSAIADLNKVPRSNMQMLYGNRSLPSYQQQPRQQLQQLQSPPQIENIKSAKF